MMGKTMNVGTMNTPSFPLTPGRKEEDESHLMLLQAGLGAFSEVNLSLHAAHLSEKLISACWKGNGKRPNDYFKMNLALASSIQISVVFFQSELFRSTGLSLWGREALEKEV